MAYAGDGSGANRRSGALASTVVSPTPKPADASARIPIDGPYHVGLSIPTLGTVTEPTRRFDRATGTVNFAGHTPEGAMAARVRARRDHLEIDAWGDGAAWIVSRGDALAAHDDDPRRLRFDHEALDEANRRHPGLRHAATGLVVDVVLARVLGQRVRATEAARSWNAMCREVGGPAPGPLGLVLPPAHDVLAQRSLAWFHEHGVERGRAETMIAVARMSRRLGQVVDMDLPDAYRRLRSVPRLGPWTVNGVARVALGDPDAIIVGDFWICHTVCSFFTGRPRGSDDEMLELVAPWAGQRGRVERLVHRVAPGVQRFAPGRRTPSIRHR